MTTLERLSITIAIIIVVILAAASGGIFIGQRLEKQKSLKAAITAFENSHEVENEVEALTPYQRCLAVGGVPDQCKIFLRGLDKTAKGE
ncbi:hypothetical protein [Bartonella choladocola]|uniref:Uncharacterized protein n=1 Tax=Bartonella choladocola TaxID=2750995 RepID=A0A1U9MIV9_9HYPH|nr:hypothetical protein [Bartonella choladocola]AQT47897.1 hypothetical protein BBC0122_017980 [Bartonella choladocola]